MLPKRSLLYHRGLDDHVGTYVTDYVYCVVCILLCIQLMIRIRRQWKLMSQEQTATSQRGKFRNWLPWNWPQPATKPVTITSCAVLMIGISNSIVTLLGGLTHQFVQTIEPYRDAYDAWTWLVIWRTGASFSAFICFCLFIMSEQLLVQENFLRISRPFRIAYYAIVSILCLCFLAYNFIPLAGNLTEVDDPFTIGPSFIVVFAVMLIYALVATFVVIGRFCINCMHSSPRSEDESNDNLTPVRTVGHKHTENHRYRSELYTCCKAVVVHCHDSDDVNRIGHATGRRWDLFVMFVAPWIFVSSGVMNHFLKSKCADSDDAVAELGCPLPNEFNHNAAMHVIQIISMILFFVGENMAITRRHKSSDAFLGRIATSSTLVFDVTDDGLADSCCNGGTDLNKSKNETCNNNKPNRRDDFICDMPSSNQCIANHAGRTMDFDDLNKDVVEPKFPTHDYDVRPDDSRSLYDNLLSAA